MFFKNENDGNFYFVTKTFLEILVILLRMLSEHDFIANFNSKEGFDPIKTTPEKKKELLACANKLLGETYITDDLFEYIFDKDSGDSLFNITNNAIHLFTDRNEVSKTSKQNLNFIFSSKKDIKDQWEYIYLIMPMLISFLADLIDLLVFKSINLEKEIYLNKIRKRNEFKIVNNVL